MVPGFLPKEFNKDYQEGVDAGFEMAEGWMMKAVRDFYKSIKHKQLRRMATSSTASSHSCNCDYCDIDPKDLKSF